jgi:peptide/nickel transport system substrate-binding protein
MKILLKTTLVSALMLGLLPTVAKAEPSTVTIRIPADIRSVIPGVNRDNNTDGIMVQMVEGLVAYGEDGQPKPMLADKIDVSKDGRSYTFTLRQGVKFHNGKGLTAEDVISSWDYYVDPKHEWRCLPEMGAGGSMKVTSVKAMGPSTVVFELEQPNALFLSTMARTDCGMTGILQKESFGADGKVVSPIGTGPFKFAEWKRKEFVRLEKFQDYSVADLPSDGLSGAKHPLVDELKFVVVPDDATAKAAVLAGDLDIIPEIANSDYKELKEDRRVNVSIAPTMGPVGLIIQTRDPLLRKVEMRQALAAALDIPSLVDAVTSGTAKPNNSIVPSTSPYYGEVEQRGFVHDLGAVKTLLEKAGYKGEPVVIETNKNYQYAFDTAVIAQQMLQSAGINASIEVIEWATQFEHYSTGKYQVQVFAYSGRMDPSLSYDVMSGSKDKQPRKLWDEADVRALLAKTIAASDKAERQAIFDQLHEKFIADVPMVPLYNFTVVAAANARIESYKASTVQLPLLWNVSVKN